MTSRVVDGTTIELRFGNITHEAVDAIVNAANRSLLGGGGVDGAIHAAGGPAILAECRRLGGCPTGEARITGAGRLPARHVIHTVGPVHRDGGPEDAGLLCAAYRSSLALAVEHGLRRVAFPSISTGAYGYPIAEASGLALGTVVAFCREHPGTLDLVRFVLFSAADLAVYEGALPTT